MTEHVSLEHTTLESFFYEELEQSKERRGHALSTEVEAYLVHLLARYVRRTNAAGRRSRPLALEYLRARGEHGAARAHALRGVGDRALYISGVAPRSLDRTPVDVRYVKGLGEAAYREVARAEGPLRVLGEVAERFDQAAALIGDVVELRAEAAGAELMALYERWRRTGDARDARKLAEAGVLLDVEAADVMQ